MNKILLIVVSVLVVGCNSNKYNTVTDNAIIEIHRFEQDLFEVDLYNFSKETDALFEKYGEFLPLFTNKVIDVGDSSRPDFLPKFKMFVTDQAVYDIYKAVSNTYPNMEGQSEQLSKAFGRYQYFFPEKIVPEVYTYISGFNQSFVTTEDFIGISLEKYLGNNHDLYKQVYPPIPQYAQYKMNPTNLPCDVLRAWSLTEFEFNNSKDNLLSNIIYEGRSYYFTKQLFPDISDTLIFGFTPEQIKFCKNRESDMYTYLIEQKLLFSTDKFRMSQFINDGPYTKDFYEGSPARAAVWLGCRIVDSYMKKNKEVTLEQLMQVSDYQKLFNDAQYHP